MMSLQPAPRAQITSWPTGSVALLQHSECTHSLRLFHKHVTLYIYSTRQRASKVTGVKHKQWTGRCGSCWAYWCTCRSQPAELGSSSWPARGSDRSAGWGSVKSSVSAGYFLWPLTTPPDLPPDSHFRWEHSGRSTKKKKADRQSRGSNSPVLQSSTSTICSAKQNVPAMLAAIYAGRSTFMPLSARFRSRFQLLYPPSLSDKTFRHKPLLSSFGDPAYEGTHELVVY